MTPSSSLRTPAFLHFIFNDVSVSAISSIAIALGTVVKHEVMLVRLGDSILQVFIMASLIYTLRL